jgi:hypothetical protein
MDNNINVSDINLNLQQSFIHYDPNRIDFTVNNFELELLETVGDNVWKDVFLATFGLGIPCLINAYSNYCAIKPEAAWTKELFINLLFGGISIVLSVISFYLWRKNRNSFDKLVSQIKSKPRYRLPNQT